MCRCEPYALLDGVDYRRQAIAATSALSSYFFPLNQQTRRAFEQKFADASGTQCADARRPHIVRLRKKTIGSWRMIEF